MKVVVETKPSWSPEGDESKGSTYESKGQASNPKRYIGKKIQTKTQGLELKANTNFKFQCSGPEGYIFDIGPRASYKFTSTMKELERYLGTTYSNICHTAIMIKTPETFPCFHKLSPSTHPLQGTRMV